MCVELLPKEEIKQSTLAYLKRNWEWLPLITRRVIVLGAGMGAATSVILLTSVIFNVDTARGGLSFDAFGKPSFDSKTGGFFGNGIELTLAPGICDTVLKYSSKYRWANNFIPSGPQDINYGLMNLALQSISYYKKIGKENEIFLSPEVLYHL
jgi:hypothetical protein